MIVGVTIVLVVAAICSASKHLQQRERRTERDLDLKTRQVSMTAEEAAAAARERIAKADVLSRRSELLLICLIVAGLAGHPG